MKKSNYILITSVLFILIFITVYFVDTKIHKEEIRSEIMESIIINSGEEIVKAKYKVIDNPTNKKIWKSYIQKIKEYYEDSNINKTYGISTKINLVDHNTSYIIRNYKTFKDTNALRLLEKVHHSILEFKIYYNANLYAEVLYELGKIEQAKKIEKKYHDEKYAKVPEKVKKWIDSELAKNTKIPLTSLDTPVFFNDSPARIVGYIKGYNGNQALDFTTGMFYAENVFEQGSRTPILINIHPDGRFEADIPLSHSVFSKIFINNKWIPFYLEPQQTLAMVIDAKGLYPKEPRKNGFKNTLFLGSLAQVNYDLINYNHEDFNYDDYYKKTQKLSNDEYKKYRQEQLQENLENYHNYVFKRQITSKATKILKNTILVDNAVYLFDFLQHHPTDVLLEPLNKIYKPNAKDDFYEFLNTIPWNDQSLLLADQFSTFINRFETLNRLQINSVMTFSSDDDYVPKLTKDLRAKDSIAKNVLGIDVTSFVYNLPKIRRLKYVIEFVKNEEKVTTFWNTVKTTNNPILNKKALQIINQYFIQKEQGVEIPNTKAGTILKKIIKPFKNKTIFLKFWTYATGTHSLKNELEKAINPIQQKYKDEVVFIYITEDDKNFKDQYTVFVKEHNLSNNFKISEDETHHIQQLFKNAKTDFWVFINKEGKIMNNDFPLYYTNVKTEIQKAITKE
ncbi:hypothetical protein QVZ41_09505 [Wenyingzhuangia sp. chi5]|uniref:Thioredoxin domain-containing protein n=1 Tax=Wenyingzhuangia gilva TaxID=3057677 RepID=A0ABT8VSY8_9FLAO|nr:hypothetical protein [Wenyingzhuangia sp. chi5]MDO3695078.1 hypothetical protein [Wenyingzhuangia sp. chi5]